ncbi:hypothetical protein [Corynebacterium mayonis]|uniref:hypothetical protein n=1 Tax=Corynebacterium mayonis TaxID=3062461 RepID=UPI0031401583
MNTLSRYILAPLTASAVILTSFSNVAGAAPDPTTGVELNVGEDRFVAGAFSFNPSAGTTEGARALKELRSYMWDENPQFRGFKEDNYEGTLRDAARKEGITTKEQYLNISVDQDLNWIAIQRASEVTAYMAHKRPDGSQSTTATRNGRSLLMESLAVGTRNLDSTVVQNWGKRQLPNLIANQGRATAYNTDLIHMIHPRHTVWGFGAVENRSRSGFAAVTGNTLVTPGSANGEKVSRYLHRAATESDTPTGVKTGTPPAQDTQAPLSSGAVLNPAIIILIAAIPILLSLLAAVGQLGINLSSILLR